MPIIDLRSYKPVNTIQAEYHASRCPNKLLLGGMGAGKTYPTMHEIIFHCLKNDNHNFAVFRNTWDSLKDNIEKELVDLCTAYGIVKPGGWQSAYHNLTLINGCQILFRPLTLTEAQFKGMNLCGFACDDPDTKAYSEIMGFLYSRLRDRTGVKADRFLTLFAANWEGLDWLAEKFILRGGEWKKPGTWSKEDPFAYWMPATSDNPTLQADFITTLAMVKSQEWMDRYVYMKDLHSYTGLILHEFTEMKHVKDLSWCVKDEKKQLLKILAVDVGLGVTCVYSMGTDHKAVYTYKEWYRREAKPHELAAYIKERQREENIQTVIIDPASARNEQTSGTSMKRILADYGVRTTGGSNAVQPGIQLMKDLIQPANGEPAWFIDRSCVHWRKEQQGYRYKERPSSHGADEIDTYTDEPVKRNDHGIDSTRYGTVYLSTYLTQKRDREEALRESRQRLWNDRISKLKMYRGVAKPGQKTPAEHYRDTIARGRRSSRRPGMKPIIR